MLTVESNLDKLANALDRTFSKNTRFAASLALNRVAEFAVQALKANMNVVFDRPKPFVLNSLFFKRSTKTNLIATIFHSDKVLPYLEAEIVGGARGKKPFEIRLGRQILVPTGNVARDSYGGVSKGMIKKVLSQAKPLGAKSEYVIVKPENALARAMGRTSTLSPGIYQRKDGKIKALFLFKDRASYTPRYDMKGVVERTAAAEFGRQFNAAMDYALSTAKVNL